MYIPTYKISDKLLNSIVKLETDKAQISNPFTPPGVKANLERKTKVMNIFHIGHFLGLNITLKDAEKVVEGRRLALEDDYRSTILNNFRNVLEFNRSSIANSYIDVDTNLIIHLNKLLLNGWRENWEVKFRTAGEQVDVTLDNWEQFRDRSIDDTQTQQALLEALDWYKASQSRIYDLVRVAVFLYRFWEIYPMLAMNKLTGIALADFLLTKYGYSNNSYVSVAKLFDSNEDDFVEAWSFAKERYDLSIWLENFVKNIGRDLNDVKDEYHKLLSEQEKTQKQPFLDLNKRQLKILKYLQTIPTVKREDYCQMMDVSTMTAFRDLNDLVDKKLVRIEGQGRGTKYMLYNR